MVRNLNDSPLERMVDAQQHARRENPFESSSVRDGRVRFIGGTLRVDAGGRAEIVGTLQVDGTSTVTGSFTVSGPWNLTGNGTITGNVTISGTVDLTGKMNVTGDIEILGPGKIKVGNVIIENGKIKAGGMTIDPDTNGGQVDFGGGRFVNAGSGYLGVYDGERFIVFNASGVTMFAGGRSVAVGPDGIRATGVPKLPSTDGVKAWFGEDENGYMVRVDPAVGGPMSGLSWPLPPSTVTSEYGPRESPGEGGSSFHEGIDFGASEGTPIPSAGPGVVEFAGDAGGYGNCVVINHGSGVKTRYAHMATTPEVAVGQTVARAQVLGPVGQTGISFGPHLHFEVEVNGVKVNPRTKLPPS